LFSLSIFCLWSSITLVERHYDLVLFLFLHSSYWIVNNRSWQLPSLIVFHQIKKIDAQIVLLNQKGDIYLPHLSLSVHIHFLLTSLSDISCLTCSCLSWVRNEVLVITHWWLDSCVTHWPSSDNFSVLYWWWWMVPRDEVFWCLFAHYHLTNTQCFICTIHWFILERLFNIDEALKYSEVEWITVGYNSFIECSKGTYT